MSSTSILRGSLCRTARLARNASSSAPPSSTTLRKPTLSPDKLRALISIYHDSESFITKENLDETIDTVFGETGELGTLSSILNETYKGDMNKAVEDRRKEPKFGSNTRTTYNSLSQRHSWSVGEATEREKRVYAALFGTDAGTRRRPGLEIVQEEEERIQKGFQQESEEEKPRRAR